MGAAIKPRRQPINIDRRSYREVLEGINEMDPPLCGAAVISHNEVSASDHHVTARRRVQ
jgi:hypothetical protein